jgi:hypothetical protein
MRIALRSVTLLPYQQKSPAAFAEGFIAILCNSVLAVQMIR